jgi:hypothetical protein
VWHTCSADKRRTIASSRRLAPAAAFEPPPIAAALHAPAQKVKVWAMGGGAAAVRDDERGGQPRSGGRKPAVGDEDGCHRTIRCLHLG